MMTDTTPDGASPEIIDLALTGLLEVTPPESVGDVVGSTDEGDGVVSVLFANRMAGYPGWHWTVSVARVDGDAPTVLEVELMPADGALLAPEWVPWSDRLADYRAAAQGPDEDESDDDESDDDESDDDESDDDDEDDLDDDSDADEDDLDDDDDDDLDGVDVDELDPAEVDPALHRR